MPLGMCGTCSRTYIFEDASGEDRCPVCSASFRRIHLRELRIRLQESPSLLKPGPAAEPRDLEDYCAAA